MKNIRRVRYKYIIQQEKEIEVDVSLKEGEIENLIKNELIKTYGKIDSLEILSIEKDKKRCPYCKSSDLKNEVSKSDFGFVSCRWTECNSCKKSFNSVKVDYD